MNIDIRTLILVLAITHLIQVVVFIQQYKTNKTYNGLDWWLLWCTAEAVGFGFVFLRGIPAIASFAILFQNVFIVMGAVFIYIGILRFLNKKENLWFVLSFYLLYVLALMFFIFIKNNIVIRSIIINLSLAILFYISAWRLFFYKKEFFAASANFISVILIIQGLFFSYRAVMIYAGTPINDFFIPTFFNSLTYFDAIIVGLLLTFGFIIMLNQRLNFDVLEAKTYFEAIFNMSPDATLITRLDDGKILNINQGFTNLTGYNFDESIGKSSIDIPIWENPDDRQKIVAEIDKNGFCRNMEAPFLHKDGKQIIGLLSASKIILQDKPVIISVTRDITDRRKAEVELRNLKDNLALEVDEKTKELRERIIELERYYNATINREIRVKELEDELKKLKEKD